MLYFVWAPREGKEVTAKVVSQEMGVRGLVVSLGTRMAEGFQLWVREGCEGHPDRVEGGPRG